jgi:hypothetical protein
MTPVGRVLVAGAVVALAASGLGGCRGVEQTALPASPARSTPAVPPPSVDPLGGLEAGLDAVERALDADVGAAGGR